MRAAATALLASTTLVASGSARAESLESLAITALKGVCLGDATKRRDDLAQSAGWTPTPIKAEGAISRAAWDREGDGGRVEIRSSAAQNEFKGNYCTVVVHGDPGKFLERAKTLLYDAQFGVYTAPKQAGLINAWALSKGSYDGHHSWVALGGLRPFAEPPLSAGETLEPLAFVQVTYFFDR